MEVDQRTHPTTVVSSYQSIVRRLEALRAAIAELEHLKLVVLNDRDLEKRIAAVHARLPEVIAEPVATTPAPVY